MFLNALIVLCGSQWGELQTKNPALHLTAGPVVPHVTSSAKLYLCAAAPEDTLLLSRHDDPALPPARISLFLFYFFFMFNSDPESAQVTELSLS